MAEPEDDIDLGFDDEVRLHPILSNDEFKAAQAKARAKIEAERIKAAARSVEEAEVERLRREEGLTTGIGVKDQLVDITIDLPPFAPALGINFDTFEHGVTYRVPRHQADTLREMMSRAWEHEDEVKGRSKREHYGINRQAKINGVTGVQSEQPQVVFRG